MCVQSNTATFAFASYQAHILHVTWLVRRSAGDVRDVKEIGAVVVSNHRKHVTKRNTK